MALWKGMPFVISIGCVIHGIVSAHDIADMINELLRFWGVGVKYLLR